jgi:hypothetical protein
MGHDIDHVFESFDFIFFNPKIFFGFHSLIYTNIPKPYLYIVLTIFE